MLYFEIRKFSIKFRKNFKAKMRNLDKFQIKIAKRFTKKFTQIFAILSVFTKKRLIFKHLFSVFNAQIISLCVGFLRLWWHGV